MITALLRITGGAGRPLLVRHLLATTLNAACEGVAFGLLVPLLTALLAGHTGDAAHWLVPLALAVAVGWAAHYAMETSALGLSSAWRRALYERIGDHVVRLPLGWFDETRTARLERLLGQGVNTSVRGVHVTQTLVTAVVRPATILVFLLCYDAWLALAVLVAVPVVLAVFSLARRMTERTDAAHDAAAAEASARLVEFAGAQPVLRAAGGADGGRRELGEALDGQHTAARRQLFGALPGLHLGELVTQLAFTALLVVGLLLATHGGVSAPRIIALLVLGVHFLQPFAVIAGAAAGLNTVRAAVGRIDAVLSTEPLPEPPHPQPLRVTPDDPPPDVELDGVTFGYGPDEAPVLRDFSLRVPAGRTVALVGASGAGKTTVTKLVARFFDVIGGTVRIGGVDVRRAATTDLMNTVSLVFQDVRLVDGTIEENIRLGRPGATDEEVRAAARRARVDTIVARLPAGWASQVGEGGSLLSGGERQRVAIARTLLKDTPVVLLDEATSALDAENEVAVHEALRELGRGRTLLVIAHQLATIADADEIAVLDAGRVVEQGPHEQLRARGGQYAALWSEYERARGWRLGNR
ncbi:ABC transporter ATP-binding protein [Streptomyces sp. 8L]|uniref:ABC transporter ATP-binding protein n=1 Tax=Streptomyces sp. 8L TaxID=2877242 RepID=UPI001CD63A9A|nr:ABC transporter ATP-binding protein [Streptomyces sp. 8L]MCA1222513.1 ABC transporter ATP-binding protein/permease [Streptomyces sp. 8L]